MTAYVGFHRRDARGRRVRAALLALAVVLPTTAVLAAGAPSEAATTSSVTKSKTISRANLVAGQDVEVETKNFSLTVEQTKNLRDRQPVTVSWSGAHPTGGTVADTNSGTAKTEEYPVVLLECRGVDSTSVPVAQRIRPESCWTASPGERFASATTAFQPWQLDRYAPAVERKALVNAATGSDRPADCGAVVATERWVPFVAEDGTDYRGGTAACAGAAPEATFVDSTSMPSNTTYGITDAAGKGTTEFDVWTSETNASLGCGPTIACSIVAIPVLGISCDADADDLPAEDRVPAKLKVASANRCAATGVYAPGAPGTTENFPDRTVTGELWWSASNWRNRVSVPLNFAPLSNVCDLVGASGGVDIYGSELLTQASTQWAPHFCLDKNLFRFRHVELGEPPARGLVSSGGADAAFISDPPADGFSSPIVNAPTAFTGFAITFTVDDVNRAPVRQLRLTPRLIAKLLTMSYPSNAVVKKDYGALHNNPQNLSLDPEFIKLNPGIPQGVGQSETASTLLSLSSDSDVITALTSYIQADPKARKWLDGTPDEYGMVVNPNYKNIELPVDSWPQSDDFIATNMATNNTCLRNDPVPYLPQVASPMSRLRQIAVASQYTLSNVQTDCLLVNTEDGTGAKLVAQGRQPTGFRFMLAVNSLGDAARYNLTPASLQTGLATRPTFVAPTDASLRATAAMLVPDETSHSWPIPYAKLRAAAGSTAYPGAMVVYSSVRTKGVVATDAKDYAEFLRFAVGAGQTPGEEVGELPDGYLPLTKANGLDSLATYTKRAATAIAAQKGEVPAITPTSGSKTGDNSKNPSTTSPGSGTTATPAPAPTPAASVVAVPPTVAPAPAVSGPRQFLAAIGRTLGLGTGLAALVLPAVLGFALLAGLVAGVGYLVARSRAAGSA